MLDTVLIATELLVTLPRRLNTSAAFSFNEPSPMSAICNNNDIFYLWQLIYVKKEIDNHLHGVIVSITVW